MAETPSLEQLTCAVFTPHVNQRFQVRPTQDQAQGAAREVVLVEAQTMAAAPDGAARQPFALVFASDDPTPLGQQICAVEHPALGALDMFLVPIGPGQDAAMRYEAVFA